jgi:hypothetical protein
MPFSAPSFALKLPSEPYLGHTQSSGLLPSFDPERQPSRPRAQLVPNQEVAVDERKPDGEDAQPRRPAQALDLDDMLARFRIELGNDVVLADRRERERSSSGQRRATQDDLRSPFQQRARGVLPISDQRVDGAGSKRPCAINAKTAGKSALGCETPMRSVAHVMYIFHSGSGVALRT